MNYFSHTWLAKYANSRFMFNWHAKKRRAQVMEGIKNTAQERAAKERSH